MARPPTDRLLKALTAQTEVYDTPLRLDFEQGWREWKTCIGMARDRYRKKPTHDPGTRRRVTILPDLHVPFHDPLLLADFIERESKISDLLIGAGDFGDSYSHSRFTLYESMPYAEEWAACTLAMKALSEAWAGKPIHLILGNHDARLEKQLRSRLTQDMVNALSLMTGGVLCPITALTKRFNNITIAKHVVPNTGLTVDWFTTVGKDCLVLHAEKFSKVPGSALRAVEEWVEDNRLALGLDQYRLICLAHTHQLSKFPWGADKLLLETGCLCLTQGYMTSARVGGRPQRRGYCYLSQDLRDGEWVTDLNSVDWHWYDVDEETRSQ